MVQCWVKVCISNSVEHFFLPTVFLVNHILFHGALEKETNAHIKTATTENSRKQKQELGIPYFLPEISEKKYKITDIPMSKQKIKDFTTIVKIWKKKITL